MINLTRLKPPAALFPSAAALSFYSVLNLIPLMYIGFFILAHTPSFSELSQKVKIFLLQLLFPTADASLAGTFEGFLKGAAGLDAFGFIALIFALFSTFCAFEKIICEVTATPKRSIANALALYWALTTLAPIGLGASFYASYKIQSQLGINLLALLPFFIIWALFCASFYISINANLKLLTTLCASFLAALVWNLIKAAFLWYLSQNTQLASIYGGFSAIFVFFILLYFSWIIYLYAAALLVRFNKIAQEPIKEEIIKPKNNARNKKHN